MIYIDNRWSGHHGIGRFSKEVLQRVSGGIAFPSSQIQPSSPLDSVNLARLRLSRKDVVYTPGYNAGLSAAKQIVTLHDLIHLADAEEASTFKRIYYEAVVRPAIRRAGLVLTVSDVSRNKILEWLGKDSIEVINVGNGCSSEFSRGNDKQASRSSNFLFVGNSKPHKNLGVVLRALKMRPGYSLTVVTSSTEEVAKMVEDSKVRHQVSVVGGLSDEDLADLYRESTALLMPSTLEGFGLPALESLMCGTQVVYWSGCESVAEIVGEAGLATLSATDADEWAQALDSASQRSSEVLDLDINWAEKYRWDTVGRNVTRVLEDFS